MSKQIEDLKLQTKVLFKVVDKLEQRIATLEKVLASHAKCIGEMREDKIKARLLYEAQSQVVN